MFILICALYVSYECVCVCVGFLLPLHVGVRVNTCTDMIVSVNKMQCFDKVCVWGGGVMEEGLQWAKTPRLLVIT